MKAQMTLPEALAMLERWTKEDAGLDEEEADRNEAILKGIDEHRMSDRKLFAHLWENITL